MIWLFGIIILLVLWGFYPVRMWLEADLQQKLQAKVYWQPLPFIKWKLCIFRLPKEKPEKTVKQGEKDVQRVEQDIAQAEASKPGDTIPKDRQTIKDKLKALLTAKDDLKELAVESLGYLHIETLELNANLAGNAALSAFGGGLLWSALGFGLGVLSTKVKKYPRQPAICIGLNPLQPWAAHTKICLMMRVGSTIKLGVATLKLLWKNRQWLKQQIKQKRRKKKLVQNYGEA